MFALSSGKRKWGTLFNFQFNSLGLQPYTKYTLLAHSEKQLLLGLGILASLLLSVSLNKTISVRRSTKDQDVTRTCHADGLLVIT